jgi:hypothetical protein
MTYRAGLLTGIVVTAAVAALAGLAWSAFGPRPETPDAGKPPAPATVLKEEASSPSP